MPSDTTTTLRGPIQTVLICRSQLVESPSKHYQSRGISHYLQKALEDPAFPGLPPELTKALRMHSSHVNYWYFWFLVKALMLIKVLTVL